jgi:hypothetical protein
VAARHAAYDGRVTDTGRPAADDDPDLAERRSPASPGERRAARPPSEPDRVADAELVPTPDPATSRGRGVFLGALAGLAGAAAITILGGALAVSAGLLVIGAATGWAVAASLRVGSGGHFARGGRVRIALALALGAIALGQAGLWVFARAEGGVLGPLDYLWEVFGALVPLQILAAAVVAWITAR